MPPRREIPFDELVEASAEMLGLLMLKRDPYAARLDEAAQIAAVSAALADGTATANELRRQFCNPRPCDIAHELGVPVATTNNDPIVSSIWRFAEYRPRPPLITLYARGIAALERALGQELPGKLLGPARTADVFIAHELYHHVEATRPERPIADRHQATLLKVGRWRWRSGVASLGEIAAGAFAQTLLGLPRHPRTLDYVACRYFAAGGHITDDDSYPLTVGVPV